MPSAVVQSLAKKSGLSVSDVEAAWKEIKTSLKDQGHKESDDNFYAMLVRAVKKSIGVSTSESRKDEVMENPSKAKMCCPKCKSTNIHRVEVDTKTIESRNLERGPGLGIDKDAREAYAYVMNVLNNQGDSDSEALIARSAKWSYYYARDVIGGRWPKGEVIISESPKWSYQYALDVVGERWPEGEAAISRSLGIARRYSDAFPDNELFVVESSKAETEGSPEIQDVEYHCEDCGYTGPLTQFKIGEDTTYDVICQLLEAAEDLVIEEVRELYGDKLDALAELDDDAFIGLLAEGVV